MDIIDLKSTMNQFNMIKICTTFIQHQDTNSSSHRLYTRRHWNISRDIKQGAKISWSKGIKIIQSLFSYHCIPPFYDTFFYSSIPKM